MEDTTKLHKQVSHVLFTPIPGAMPPLSQPMYRASWDGLWDQFTEDEKLKLGL